MRTTSGRRPPTWPARDFPRQLDDPRCENGVVAVRRNGPLYRGVVGAGARDGQCRTERRKGGESHAAADERNTSKPIDTTSASLVPKWGRAASAIRVTANVLRLSSGLSSASAADGICASAAASLSSTILSPAWAPRPEPQPEPQLLPQALRDLSSLSFLPFLLQAPLPSSPALQTAWLPRPKPPRPRQPPRSLSYLPCLFVLPSERPSTQLYPVCI